MDFTDNIRALADKVEDRIQSLETEEATKNGLIMPFIQCLGYNPFEPTEVVPEFIADIGERKGEKVDYAICKDGAPIILIECKPCRSELKVANATQLQRYFSCLPDIKFSVLTNGVRYLFYSDLENTNVMDSKPFLEVNMLKLDDNDIEQLKQFTKERFDKEAILSSAGALKWTREILQELKTEYRNYSDDFVRFFAKRVFSGPLTEKRLEDFRPIVRKAFQQFVNAMITETLNRARDIQVEEKENSEELTKTEPSNEIPDEPKVLTTEQEWQGFYIVKAILAEQVDISRVTIRDVQSYCGILLDDNNRKPLCRLWFNTPNRLYVSLFDNGQEDKIHIACPSELYNLSDRIRATAKYYDEAGTT